MHRAIDPEDDNHDEDGEEQSPSEYAWAVSAWAAGAASSIAEGTTQKDLVQVLPHLERLATIAEKFANTATLLSDLEDSWYADDEEGHGRDPD